MFNWIVRYSLHNRLFVLAFAALLLVYGGITAWRTAGFAGGAGGGSRRKQYPLRLGRIR